MRTPTRGAALVAIAVVSSGGALAQASPLDIFGFGGASPALAGTGVATTAGYDSVYLNPAGLGGAVAKRATVGGQSGAFRLTLDGKRRRAERPDGLLFGGALPVPLGGALRDRVGFGIGVHFPLRVINRARSPLPGVPWFSLLETRSHVVALQTAIGLQLDERWKVGGGALVLAALRGGIHVAADAAGRFTSQSEQELTAAFTPIVGAQYRVSPALVLGAVARGSARTDFEIVVTNSLADSLPLTIPTLTIAGVSQYDPVTVAVEAAWHRGPDLTLTGQLTYQHWAAYPLPTVNPVASSPPQEQPGFHDIVIPRVAVEWRRRTRNLQASLRAGYFFALSPAPEMSGQQSLLDNHRHVATAGLGLALLGLASPIYIDVWGQLHLLQPRHHTKDPSKFEPGATLPFDSIDTGGRIVAAGMTLGVDL